VVEVLMAGGGTAGHVNPLLAVADELRRRNPSTGVVVLGTASGLESRLVPERGYELVEIPRVPLPRRPTLDWLRLPGRLRAAVGAAVAAIDERGVDVVIGFGGYVATPAYLAARRRGVPIVIHEQNARPGLANRLGARWAASVAVTFPGTALRQAQVSGLPLRPEIAALVAERAADLAGSRAEARVELGLQDRPTLLVTGGSLGAVSLNRAVSGAASALIDAGVQIVHLTGVGKDGEVRAAVKDIRGAEHYHVLDYLDRMELALAAADLVVCRSGAGTVSELAALGLPAVYVPLPIGNGEQRLNAAPVVEAGGGLLVDDGDLDSVWLEREVIALLGDPRRLAAMASSAGRVGVADGAARVADLVLAAAEDRP
jgi:undecaprenyldiphospho-muramoylpentapeptide beta-N-acetylglucosaminyltransferase